MISFILFENHRKQNCDNELLKRPLIHSFLKFREELKRGLIDLDEYEDLEAATGAVL